MTQPVTYSGWQSEKSGFMGRLSGPGFALVAVGCTLLLLPVNLASWTAAGACVPVAVVLLVLAFGRVSGLSADEWILLAVRHQIAVARNQNVFVSGPFAPARPGRGSSRWTCPAPWPDCGSWRPRTGSADCWESRTTRSPGRTPRCPGCPSQASPWWTRTSRPPGSPRGRLSSVPSAPRTPRSCGCPCTSAACPTTAPPCGHGPLTTSPPTRRPPR